MKNGLFKKPEKAVRVAKVECLDKKKGIFTAMQASRDQKSYVVVLCLANKVEETVFHCEASALLQMEKYKELYKETVTINKFRLWQTK